MMYHYPGQDVQVFSQEHPGTDLPQIRHPGAKRANQRNQKHADPEATGREAAYP